jgi:hypothetical protein
MRFVAFLSFVLLPVGECGQDLCLAVIDPR